MAVVWVRAEGRNLAGDRIGGVVHDATGALIPGAEITILQGGNSVAKAVSDGQGGFTIAVPGPGSYTVQVKASGFADSSAQATVTAADPAANVDVTLAINGNAETVQVTADALAAETTSTQLGETLETKKIESVPLNGRSFTDLMAVQPGIVPVNTAQPGAVVMTGVATTPPSGDANPGNLSISGQRENSNGFRVNGADVEEDVNMGTSIVPNLDSIDSFRVLTSNFDAEYGNSSGGQVLVTTKSGTSQVHGSAFEFLRNTALDARNYFSSNRAAYRQNQFGAAVGGPVPQSAIHWFADYQGTRLTEGIDTGDIAVPTTAERSGNFQVPGSSASLLSGCVSGPYLASLLSQELGKTVSAGDPYSAQSVCPLTNGAEGPVVFPGNTIPQSIWSAPAKYLLAQIPAQNAGAGLFETADAAETLQDDKGGLRADWRRGKGALSAYYFLDHYSLDNPYPTGTGGASVPGFDATSNGLAQLFVLEQTQTIGSSMLNDAHLSYMRNFNSVGQPRGGVGPTLAAQGFSEHCPAAAVDRRH